MHAVDFAQGEMQAVPLPASGAPTIDADLSDWTLTAQEPMYISAQTAELMNAQWAVMYDDEALYISSVASLPNRKFTNTNNPQDAYWSQDIAQIRLSSDPELGYPLDWNGDEESDRVVHASFWTNTATGEPFIALAFGTKFNQGGSLNPEGSEIAMDVSSPEGYVIEAKIPWSALNVPDGKNPFKEGEIGAFTAETLWIGGDKARTLLNYNKHPGAFAFRSPNAWGKLVYAKEAPAKRKRPTMESILADAKASMQVEPAKIGVPFTVEVPGDGLKVSVNIVDENGAVIREVMGGESHPKGQLTVYWDGRDQFMNPLEPGNYQWAAYFHEPLKAVYQGGVGSSGNPYFKTLDGKGGWGGDHSEPVDVFADDDSLYFLWPVAEAGRAVVRTDYDGNVIWRIDPFVGGGFGPFYAAGSNDDYIFLARSDQSVAGEGKTSLRLVRLEKESGALTIWDPKTRNDELELVVSENKLLPKKTISYPIMAPPGKNMPRYENNMARQPEGTGVAASKDRVYVSSYGSDKIFVVDDESGAIVDELACPGPRGVFLTNNGDLYAVSFKGPGEGKILRFKGAQGSGEVVLSSGIEAPWDVAVDDEGRMFVSDAGKYQNVKVFDANGKPVKAIGEQGGRPWQGAYDTEALKFLQPAGVFIDRDGALLVSEASLPKVFSRIDPDSEELLDRWYGPGVYWNGTWPMPDDPRNVFYQLVHGIGRATLGGPGEVGVPNAYWNPEYAGYEHVGNIESKIPQPEVIRADNGELYFAKDSGNHAILLLKDDVMRPVAVWDAQNRDKNGNWIRDVKDRWVNVWVDQNGDGQEQPSEFIEWKTLGNGDEIGGIAEGAASMHIEPNGDLYFMTQTNKVVCVPAKGFGKDGMIEWDVSKSYAAVPVVIPSLDRMHTGFRSGLLGARLDEEGNIYVIFNAKLTGTGDAFDYPDEDTAKRMMEGMGHTSRTNAVKFAKFDPKGNLLWMAGRKATAGAKPGELYHHWNMAGIVNDKYISSGSEWGQIYFYTHDGFFVDALMNNPGEVSDPGPYTFGGETSGGRVAYFEDSGELWAYSSGMVYKVDGFSNGSVENESRSTGTVELDRVYKLETETEEIDPLVIAPFKGQGALDGEAWAAIPSSTVYRNGEPLAVAQMAFNKDYLFARIKVADSTPLENGATVDKLAFKGGDTAGFVLGPKGSREKPELGDVRIMAAMIQGEPRVIGMKGKTKGPKLPDVYETPAAGRWEFDFVGLVPGGKVDFQPVEGGYIATIAVPRSFLEFDLAQGEDLIGDIEIRLSGAGQRGLQATSRNYLYTPNTGATTMVDDIPTEARMYPEYWGEVSVQ